MSLEKIAERVKYFGIQYDEDLKKYEVYSLIDNMSILTRCPDRAKELLDDLQKDYIERKNLKETHNA